MSGSKTCGLTYYHFLPPPRGRISHLDVVKTRLKNIQATKPCYQGFAHAHVVVDEATHTVGAESDQTNAVQNKKHFDPLPK